MSPLAAPPRDRAAPRERGPRWEYEASLALGWDGNINFQSPTGPSDLTLIPGAKVARITFPDAPPPGAREIISWMTPDAPKIVEAARKVVAA